MAGSQGLTLGSQVAGTLRVPSSGYQGHQIAGNGSSQTIKSQLGELCLVDNAKETWPTQQVYLRKGPSMDDLPQPENEAADTKPGKIRTWWHPLLANILRWQLDRHYHLQEEVPVGRKPLQIDILLLQQERGEEQGELPASACQMLAGLVEHLNEFTLVEFKSPSDTLRAGDFQPRTTPCWSRADCILW
jgi:hypothetical protein